MAKENRKKLCVSSLVLGILGVIFSLIFPAAAYGCAVPGLAIGVSKKKKNFNTVPGVALNILALVLAGINSVLGVVMTVKMYASHSKDKKSLKLK